MITIGTFNASPAHYLTHSPIIKLNTDSRRTVLLFRLSSGVGGGRSGTSNRKTKTPGKTPGGRAPRARGASPALVGAREARTVLLTRDSASGRETNRWYVAENPIYISVRFRAIPAHTLTRSPYYPIIVDSTSAGA